MIYRNNRKESVQEVELSKEHNKIIRILYNSDNILRTDESKFFNMLEPVFREFVRSKPEEFVGILKQIRQSDLRCFEIGKKVLDRERKRYELD